MPGYSGLTQLFSPVREIRAGEGAGLKIVPRRGDREIELGTYEAPVQQALVENAGAGDVVYDIGANIGYFTLLAARRVGSAGAVYAFEPVPENAAAIRRSAGLNGFATVEVIDKAVGDRSGSAELHLARHIGGAMLASVGAPPDHSGSLRVDLISIDDLARTGRLRPPNLIKIDVEGAEIDVLRGLTETLMVHLPTLIVELDDATAGGLEAKSRNLASLLHGINYRVTPIAPSYLDTGWFVAHFLARPGAEA